MITILFTFRNEIVLKIRLFQVCRSYCRSLKFWGVKKNLLIKVVLCWSNFEYEILICFKKVSKYVYLLTFLIIKRGFDKHWISVRRNRLFDIFFYYFYKFSFSPILFEKRVNTYKIITICPVFSQLCWARFPV